MISLPASCQVGAWPYGAGTVQGGGPCSGVELPKEAGPLLEGVQGSCSIDLAPAQPAFALLLTEVVVAPLDELRSHKALVKLRSRQERDLRELHKKHQRKAFALTRRLLDSLAQAQAENRCRHRPGVL